MQLAAAPLCATAIMCPARSLRARTLRASDEASATNALMLSIVSASIKRTLKDRRASQQ
jgi:hypothetical protein